MNRNEKLLMALILAYCTILHFQLFAQTHDIKNLRMYTRYIENQNHTIMLESGVMKAEYIRAGKYYKQVVESM